MRVAIFGGTFDPIHNAHLTIARAAADQFSLDRVLFVPAANPPHKTAATHAPYDDRYRMVELACESDPRFVASRLEAGTEKSYSIETIRKVKQELSPGDTLYFVIGSDAFADIRTWYRYEDVIREVEFIVVTRPGHDFTIPPNARVHRLQGVELPVSSSAIRAALASGRESVEVPPKVLEYIRKRQLYRAVPSETPPAAR